MECLSQIKLEEKVKVKITKEYNIRRVRKILKSKLNSGNLIKAINTWAVSSFGYSAAFLNWKESKVQELDRKTRTLFTI